MINDMIQNMVLHHMMASHGVVAVLAVLIARIDSIILLALRFMPKERIEALLDAMNKAAKAEVEKVAAEPPPPTNINVQPHP